LIPKTIIIERKFSKEFATMPIYEYQCKACCHCFEELVLSSGDTSPKCPECQCEDVEKLMSAGCARTKAITSGVGGFDSMSSCKPSG